MWAQIIHTPVSLSETRQIVHNIKWYTSGNPSWPGSGSQLKKWLHNLFRVWQVLQDSKPSFFQAIQWYGKGRVMFYCDRNVRDLRHIIITLHSVSKKPTVRKSVLGIWGTFGYMRAKRNLCVSARLSRRRQWHPTPVLLPGKSHGWRSLVGCSPWGH